MKPSIAMIGCSEGPGFDGDQLAVGDVVHPCAGNVDRIGERRTRERPASKDAQKPVVGLQDAPTGLLSKLDRVHAAKLEWIQVNRPRPVVEAKRLPWLDQTDRSR
jgi:hypothetical protein